MRKLLVVMLGAMLLVGVGCQDNDKDMDHHKDKSMSMKDDCKHCPGAQTAKSDGTCPMCGGKVKG